VSIKDEIFSGGFMKSKLYAAFICLSVAVSLGCKAEDAVSGSRQSKYFLNIADYKFMGEYPKSYAEVKEKYESIGLKEEQEDPAPFTRLGNMIYILNGGGIEFCFWGNSIAQSRLRLIQIYSPEYEPPSMHLIGADIETVQKLISDIPGADFLENIFYIRPESDDCSLKIITDGKHVLSLVLLEDA